MPASSGADLNARLPPAFQAAWEAGIHGNAGKTETFLQAWKNRAAARLPHRHVTGIDPQTGAWETAEWPANVATAQSRPNTLLNRCRWIALHSRAETAIRNLLRAASCIVPTTLMQHLPRSAWEHAQSRYQFRVVPSCHKSAPRNSRTQPTASVTAMQRLPHG
jgi:hypothetical protein